MKYVCKEGFSVEKYDDDGWPTDEYMSIEAGEVYEVNDDWHRVAGGYDSIRLENNENGNWLELQQATIDQYFEPEEEGRVMDWCDVCKYNPPDYLSHEPDKPCGDCWVYGEGNEPTKFVETDNRQTNYDRLISKTPEEMALFLSELANGDCPTIGDCPDGMKEKTTCTPSECWLSWLKSPVEVDE